MVARAMPAEAAPFSRPRLRTALSYAEVGGLVLLAALAAWALTTPPIATRGEARVALIVRDILAHDHWIIAWRDGALASKPPLFHWMAAACARIFGLSELALRLPSLLAAIAFAAVPVVVASIARAPRTGWLAAAMLGVMPPVWVSTTEARVDMVFSAAVASALAGFFAWDRAGRRAGRATMCAAMAAGVLAKGPAGAILPFAVIALFLAWDGRLRALRSLVCVPLALAVAVVAAWYAAAYAAAGPAFLAVQLMHENVHRLSGAGDFDWTVGTCSCRARRRHAPRRSACGRSRRPGRPSAGSCWRTARGGPAHEVRARPGPRPAPRPPP